MPQDKYGDGGWDYADRGDGDRSGSSRDGGYRGGGRDYDRSGGGSGDYSSSSRSYGSRTFENRGRSAGGGGGGGGGGDSEELEVPGHVVGRVIGRGGAKIRELQDQTGCRINVARDGPGGTRTVTISGGDSSGRGEALKLINQLVEDGDSYDRGGRDRSEHRGGGGGGSGGGYRGGRSGGGDEETMDIPEDCVGSVIGRGGAKIREIQDESGCNVSIKRGENMAVISGGDAAARARARELIEGIVKDRSDGAGSFSRGRKNY